MVSIKQHHFGNSEHILTVLFTITLLFFIVLIKIHPTYVAFCWWYHCKWFVINMYAILIWKCVSY